MKTVGLLFGSFDPIHLGHISIARWAIDEGGCSEVWFVLSPQNPLKPTLAAPYEHRKRMVELTLEELGLRDVSLSTVESELEAPHYTINTIEELQRRFPEYRFELLCGTDVKRSSCKWHRTKELHKIIDFVEYPRYINDSLPFVDVSSTEIRQGEKLECLAEAAKEYMEQQRVYNFDLERGRTLYAKGDISGAINEWSKCKGTEIQNKEAETLRELASEILAYRYTEIFNP